MSDPYGVLRAVLDDDQWRRLPRGKRPTWIAPMLATLTEDRFSDERWIFERKLDGVRAVVVKSGGATRIWSRTHKDMSASYPELVQALDRQPTQDFVADGEIVTFDGKQTSFAKLQARIQLTDPVRIARTGVDVYLYLFDLLMLADADLTRFPLRVRKRVLRQALQFTDPIRYSTHRNREGEKYYRQACERGWEGLIAKRSDSAYQSKRSRDWLKFKCVRDQEMVVGGFTDPAGSRQGFGALLVGYYERGKLRYAGKVGTGYNTRTLQDLRGRMDAMEQERSPFADPVREPGAHWIRPELVVQVGFTEWTSDGKLRHPRYQGVRIDKDPRDVIRET
ncbi:MAG TPA: non-homologous end-joining DNA ligase [Actinopolymorphaceae bacterium]|jgi:DNA ligase D-like protein (predicted ligase)